MTLGATGKTRVECVLLSEIIPIVGDEAEAIATVSF
jgi:hypothetical protein